MAKYISLARVIVWRVLPLLCFLHLILLGCGNKSSSRTPVRPPDPVEKASPPIQNLPNSNVQSSASAKIEAWVKATKLAYPRLNLDILSETMLAGQIQRLPRIDSFIQRLFQIMPFENTLKLGEQAGFQADFTSIQYPLNWTDQQLDLYENQVLDILKLRDSVPPQRITFLVSGPLSFESPALWSQFQSRFQLLVPFVKELLDLSTQTYISVEFHRLGTNSSLWRNSAGSWFLRIAGAGEPEQLMQDLKNRKELFLKIPFFISFFSPQDDDLFSSIFESCVATAVGFFSEDEKRLYPSQLECSNSDLRAFSFQSIQENTYVSVHQTFGEDWLQVISELRNLNQHYLEDKFLPISVDTLSLSEAKPEDLLLQVQNLLNLRERLLSAKTAPKEVFINSSRNCQAFRGTQRNLVLSLCLNSSESEIEKLFFDAKGNLIPWD